MLPCAYLSDATNRNYQKQALTLIIKAIDSVDAGTLVIASEEKEVFWIFYLVGQ